MSSIRLSFSRLTTKKVPALAIVLVAVAGMAIGVFAASIAVTSNNYGGEAGISNNSTGTLTFADNGLSIVSAVPATNASSNFLTTGNKNAFSNANTFVVGHWVEAILVTDTVSTDTTAHAVKITVNSGTTAPSGTALFAQVTYTMTGVTGSSSPTITLYIDLGTTSITAPLNIYINTN